MKLNKKLIIGLIFGLLLSFSVLFGVSVFADENEKQKEEVKEDEKEEVLVHDIYVPPGSKGYVGGGDVVDVSEIPRGYTFTWNTNITYNSTSYLYRLNTSSTNPNYRASTPFTTSDGSKYAYIRFEYINYSSFWSIQGTNTSGNSFGLRTLSGWQSGKNNWVYDSYFSLHLWVSSDGGSTWSLDDTNEDFLFLLNNSCTLSPPIVDFNLTLNANGGFFVDGNGDTLSSATISTEPNEVDDDINYYLGTNDLINYGYTFIGWATSSNSTTPLTSTQLNALSSATTLYAIWSSNSDVTITFNSNGATSGDVPSSVTIPSGTYYNLPNNSGNLAKTGYYFKGWGTSSNSSSTYGTYLVNDDTTFYAIWGTQTTYYTVTFNANGGFGNVPDSVSVASGDDYIVPGNVSNLTRDGYTFIGWNTSSSATVGLTSVTVTRNRTLYAIWSLNTSLTYTITFNGNFNTGGTVPSSIEANNGAIFSMPGNTGNLTRSGYTFGGWTTDPSSTIPLQWILVTQDSTLYAIWVLDPLLHTITFNSNGGSGSLPHSIEVPDGSTYIIGGNTTSLYKTGYVFVGWNTDEDATTSLDSIVVTSNVTLYAIWSDLLYTLNNWYYFNDVLVFPSTSTQLNVTFINNGTLYYGIYFDTLYSELYYITSNNERVLVYSNSTWFNGSDFRQLWFGTSYTNAFGFNLLGTNGTFTFIDVYVYSMSDVFVNIADVPIRTITSLLNFDVFGTTLIVALGSLLTIMVIAFLIKKLI